MAELLDRAQDGCLTGGIQQCCGFIEEQKCCFAGQRTGDGQTLLLAATQGVNRSSCHLCQSDLLHQSMDSVTLFMTAQAGRQIEQKLAAAAGQQKLVVWILEDKGWPQLMANKA